MPDEPVNPRRKLTFGVALFGALLVGYAETSLSEAFPGSWSYFQGAMFVLVILLLPGGLAQLLGLIGRANAHRGNSVGDHSPRGVPLGKQAPTEVPRSASEEAAAR
jgi:urea transport system permease protein